MTAIDAAYPLGTALRQNFNFKNVNHVVDVGGGKGSLMVDMLRSEPHLKGTVFDLVCFSLFLLFYSILFVTNH